MGGCGNRSPLCNSTTKKNTTKLVSYNVVSLSSQQFFISFEWRENVCEPKLRAIVCMPDVLLCMYKLKTCNSFCKARMSFVIEEVAHYLFSMFGKLENAEMSTYCAREGIVGLLVSSSSF